MIEIINNRSSLLVFERKVFFFIFLIILSPIIRGQELSKKDTIKLTKYSVIYGDSLSDLYTFNLTGKVVEYEKGSCGKWCNGAVIKVKLSNKVRGYKYDYVMIVIDPCQASLLNKVVNYNVVLFKKNQKTCYLKTKYTYIYPNGLPFYQVKK